MGPGARSECTHSPPQLPQQRAALSSAPSWDRGCIEGSTTGPAPHPVSTCSQAPSWARGILWIVGGWGREGQTQSLNSSRSPTLLSCGSEHVHIRLSPRWGSSASTGRGFGRKCHRELMPVPPRPLKPACTPHQPEVGLSDSPGAPPLREPSRRARDPPPCVIYRSAQPGTPPLCPPLLLNDKEAGAYSTCPHVHIRHVHCQGNIKTAVLGPRQETSFSATMTVVFPLRCALVCATLPFARLGPQTRQGLCPSRVNRLLSISSLELPSRAEQKERCRGTGASRSGSWVCPCSRVTRDQLSGICLCSFSVKSCPQGRCP